MAAAPAPVARQLVLDLAHGESFAREDFFEGESNGAALRLVERWPDWPAPALALVGPAGSGRSHLASVWAVQSGARVLAGRALHEAALPGALATGALVLENIPAAGLNERTLFHLLNLLKEEGAWLLLTAAAAPARWNVALPDLASRLRAVPVVSLAPPDDALLRAVLVKLFADRQIAVDEALISFLVARMERSLGAAKALVSRLDREAMRLRRPVNRALAGELLRDEPG